MHLLKAYARFVNPGRSTMTLVVTMDLSHIKTFMTLRRLCPDSGYCTEAFSLLPQNTRQILWKLLQDYLEDGIVRHQSEWKMKIPSRQRASSGNQMADADTFYGALGPSYRPTKMITRGPNNKIPRNLPSIGGIMLPEVGSLIFKTP